MRNMIQDKQKYVALNRCGTLSLAAWCAVVAGCLHRSEIKVTQCYVGKNIFKIK